MARRIRNTTDPRVIEVMEIQRVLQEQLAEITERQNADATEIKTSMERLQLQMETQKNHLEER